MEIDRLYLLAVPNYMQDAPPPQSTEEEEERLEARKREELAADERHWVEGMQAAEHAQAVAANPGYLQGMINVVLGNLKLKVSANLPPIAHYVQCTACCGQLKVMVFVLQVTNLHIRYEDGVTQRGHPFAVGLTLHSIGAFTVDENNTEVFVKHAAMKLLRKAAQLSRLAVYFDTGCYITCSCMVLHAACSVPPLCVYSLNRSSGSAEPVVPVHIENARIFRTIFWVSLIEN